MPDRRSLPRFLALAAFILTVALALWLLEVEWPVVVVVMAIAWLFTAAFEWAAWRLERPHRGAVASGSSAAAEPVVPSAPTPEAAPLSAPLLVPSAQATPTGEQKASGDAEEPRPAQPPPPPPGPERPPLRPVPTSPASASPSEPATPPAAEPPASAQTADVVDLRTRTTVQPRHWNLWDLERLARNELGGDPVRFEAISYLFVHLRQFATPDGSLPTEFDGLVRESFGDLLEQRR